MEPNTYSRRRFLQGAGIGAASLGLVGLAACAPQGAGTAGVQEGGSYTFADTGAWNAEYDVVVVGFGGSGGVGAVYAADAGARVLICDKAPDGEEGGNTRFAAQMCVGATDPDAALTYYKNLAWHFDYDEEVLRAYIDGLCQMDDLMKYLGAEEPFLQENGSVVTPEYPEYEGGESIVEWYVRKGMYTSSLWQTIRAAVVDRKDAIDVWLESPATRLIQDPQSRTIVGVEIDKKGEKVLVRALNGVVLCCGGFENNGAMIQDYLGAARLAPIGTLHNNGDGVRMGIEVGADLWHMEAYESLGILCGNAWAPEEGQRALLEASLLPRAPYISLNSEHYGEGSIFLVGDDGGRFVDEYAWHRHGHQYSNGVWRNPVANYAPWLIFDGVQYEQLKADGYITEEREAKLVTASTPEELAAKIGVDSAILAQTVEDFNDFVEGGRDYTCGRDTSSMRAFDGQTYYAAEFRSCVLNTQGGPRRNKNAEVVDTQGQPIPHLYSAGELGGITPFQYNSGGNLAECMVFGKIAGANAAAEKDALPAYEPLARVDPAIAYEPGAASDVNAADDAASVELASGEYLGTGEGGMGGDITVKVAYADGIITSVEVVSAKETPEIGGEALKKLPALVVAANSADVDAVSGATLTSTAFCAAVKDAVSQA